TDPLQFSIFHSVYGGGQSLLFLVGDPKQAIYSFRNADLHTYLQARQIAQAEYTLVHNQRSVKPMLDALNALFSGNPQAFMLKGLDYHPVDAGDKKRPVLADRSSSRAPLQLWTLPDVAGARPGKVHAKREATNACAGEIARLLAAAQRGEVTLDGRPLAAGDMAVLVRSHAQGSAMRQALTALGAGSVELSQASVFRTPDAQELERVLAAILEPSREGLLRAALSTELMGLDASAIEALAENEAGMLARLTDFAEYRERWLKGGLARMLRGLFVQEQVSQRMLARPDGERRLTNLRHLAECLHEASQEHATPEALLRWLRQQRTQDTAEDATQLRLESDRNLVQIVTVHKAKGLEYPIVFCPFLWDGHPGPASDLDGREYHDDDGKPVIDFHDENDPAVDQKMKRERTAESLRLIYVALTRAVHRCYLIVGSYTSQNSTKECARGPLNWLAAGRGHDSDAWLANSLDASTIGDAWARLAQANAAAIAIADLPQGPAQPVILDRPSPEQLAAREPPRW
ncbi:MAG TPA: 3'-5' exonuclease, partial [Ramlibacter sp.]|nr:3'-5' exonuclease [Ramlibacter sp.]